MRNLLFILFVIPVAIFGQDKDNHQEMGLEELNEFLFSEYVLKKNTKPLNDIAAEDFVLIAAPGIIESKKQAIEGVGNLNISSLVVTVDKLIESENLGIVIGTLEMKGTIMNRPVPGKIRYASTFIRENGKWILKMRTMTPIRIPR